MDSPSHTPPIMNVIDVIDIINVIDIKDLQSHIISNVDTNPNTITVYHIIIGSKVSEYCLNNPDPLCNRNHECPEIVKNLLFNPEQQFSPEFLHSLSLKKDNNEITIRQVLILIDPCYIRNPKPLGLLSVISEFGMNMTSNLTVRSVLEHNEINRTTIISKLEPIAVPFDITEMHLLILFRTIKALSKFYPMLVNVMDCSSNVANKTFADSINSNSSWVHITKPECLIIDKKKQYIPIMTTNMNMNENMNENMNMNDLSIPNEDDLFTNKMLNIRWINYKNDEKMLEDLAIVKDLCHYSKNTYDFITNLYKVNTIEYSLMSIYKIWGFTTCTLDYTFSRVFGSSVTVNFSKMSFEEFANNWKFHKGFRDLQLLNFGYDVILIHKFIDYFTDKYNDREGYSYVGINPSIIDFLKVEAYEIFQKLGKYFPDSNEKYLYNVENAGALKRESIKQYMLDNGVLI